ncbi:MAG: putative PEP-binding protein [Bacteroidota bacterium]
MGVPSGALAAEILAKECDFFSIGTNGLVQCAMACDRGSSSVGRLSDLFSPAGLRLIVGAIEQCHSDKVHVGMCGEMAGMPIAIPFL